MKEPGQLFAETWFGANVWSSLDAEEREACVRVESAIRADEAAKVRAATIEEAAKRVQLFSCGGKFSSQREADLCEHLAAAIRSLGSKDNG